MPNVKNSGSHLLSHVASQFLLIEETLARVFIRWICIKVQGESWQKTFGHQKSSHLYVFTDLHSFLLLSLETEMRPTVL